MYFFFFFFSSRRRHTRWTGDWSSDVCSSDLHQERDVIAGRQAKRTEQMRALVRKLVEFAIGDRLAGAGHLIGDLVRCAAGVDGRMGHGCFLNMKMASRKRTPCSPVAKRFSCF